MCPLFPCIHNFQCFVWFYIWNSYICVKLCGHVSTGTTKEIKQSCEQTQYFNNGHCLIDINNYRAKGDTHNHSWMSWRWPMFWMSATINHTRKQTTRMFKLINKLQYSMMWLLSFLIHAACGPDLLRYCPFLISSNSCNRWH
jgi:hypothetical protein